MNITSFLKSGLIFVGGALCAMFILNLAYQSRQTKVLGTSTQTSQIHEQVQNMVGEKEKEQLGVLSKLLANIGNSIAQSPLLAPLFTTTQEVTTAVDSVKSLPTDQKSAICTQICGD